jgi:2-oxoglutarate ferredoxin oxidoreductase subunit beta
MEKIFTKTKILKNVPFHYCPGCGHSIAHRIIAEVIEEMELREIIVGIPPAGCAVLMYNYFDIDMAEAAHGRGCAVATGLKRVRPDLVVFTYQGDGDMAAIGTSETLHAANRGERISVFFINNTVYGMTGGQMAPTTLLGQKTSTTPFGRSARDAGYPIKISEIIAQLPGVAYVERVAVNNPKNIIRTKKAVKKAFEVQIKDLGFSLVEILSQCPTNWRMTPYSACKWIDEELTKFFPLGVLKDVS